MTEHLPDRVVQNLIPFMMASAYEVATLSPDPSTQNGAVIFSITDGRVITSASNSFPFGVRARLERPEKYAYIEHAERGAIYAAARLGRPTARAVMVCPWAACADCARAIVCAGIDILVRHPRQEDMENERWQESIRDGDTILTEGGVDIINWDGKLAHRVKPILRDGKVYQP